MILARQTTARARALGRRVASLATFAVVVGALMLTGGSFLVAAAYGWMSHQIGPDAAAAAVGLVLLLTGVLVAVIGRQQRRSDRAQAVLIAELLGAREPPSDPLQNVLFAASFELGRLLMARRR